MYEYNARNLLTLWGESGEIDDYAAKNWGGIVSGYYYNRWDLFLNMSLDSMLHGKELDMDFRHFIYGDMHISSLYYRLGKSSRKQFSLGP